MRLYKTPPPPPPQSLFHFYSIVLNIVIRLMKLGISENRRVTLHLPGRGVHLSLSNPSLSVNSPNNLLAYRPRFRDAHRSYLGALFLNIDGIFPCINSTSYNPTCGILTGEEDGFFRGRSFVQAADNGNSLRIFSSTENIKTYGFVIQDCAEFTTSCFPKNIMITIFCLLPRAQCG